MRNKILLPISFILGLFLIVSCEEDDNQNYGTIVPTKATLSVDIPFANPTSLVEQNRDYAFTVSIDQPQVIDVKIYLTQTAGTAEAGTDYALPSSIIIPANATSATGVMSILADEVVEETESVTITIGDERTANANLTPTSFSFNIANVTEGDLVVNMSWAASSTVTDHAGVEIDPTDLGDLRLLLTDVPYTTSIDEADGASFEELMIGSDTPDGEYYLVADFYAAMEHPTVDLDLTLTFDQVGVLNGLTYEFPAAINTSDVCGSNYFVMAKVIKTGDSYEIVEEGAASFAVTSWSGIDVVDALGGPYESVITTSRDCTGTFILGLNNEWMQTTWGESIEEAGKVYYTLDEATGEVTIASQYIFTTLYNGDLYEYTVSGTGTYDDSGAVPTLTINYTLDQEGFSPSQYLLDNGYADTNYFVATLTAEVEE